MTGISRDRDHEDQTPVTRMAHGDHIGAGSLVRTGRRERERIQIRARRRKGDGVDKCPISEYERAARRHRRTGYPVHHVHRNRGDGHRSADLDRIVAPEWIHCSSTTAEDEGRCEGAERPNCGVRGRAFHASSGHLSERPVHRRPTLSRRSEFLDGSPKRGLVLQTLHRMRRRSRRHHNVAVLLHQLLCRHVPLIFRSRTADRKTELCACPHSSRRRHKKVCVRRLGRLAPTLAVCQRCETCRAEPPRPGIRRLPPLRQRRERASNALSCHSRVVPSVIVDSTFLPSWMSP